MSNNIILPETLNEFEKLAKKKIRSGTFKWLESAAEDGFTDKANRDDLEKIMIEPRIFNSSNKIDLKRRIFGEKFEFPIIVCPMGHQTQFEKNGEKSTYLGSTKSNILSFFSTQGRIELEKIVNNSSKKNYAWQIFPFGDKKWIESEIKRAEKCKALAISLCLDAPVRSFRYIDRESRYDARKYGKRSLPVSPDITYALEYDWDFIKWIKKKSKLPLIPKGILSRHDLKKCMDLKINNIWISNHGGRMFNSGISTSRFLIQNQDLIKKYNGNIVIDGGVRKGSDIIKLKCLGADFVGLGRPIMHGLIVSGYKGVYKVLEILKNDLISSMKNGGFKSTIDFKISRLNFNKNYFE